ncbi:MAG: hypothetical protein AMJ95_01400 [Omnitrophica WOR_2 bacterium SM23_72]|nr:MAG: hypothetical protein AMJ95_01400 [Omnitrophica WOR_2 bacterium SM23_72]
MNNQLSKIYVGKPVLWGMPNILPINWNCDESPVGPTPGQRVAVYNTMVNSTITKGNKTFSAILRFIIEYYKEFIKFSALFC